MDHDRDYGIVIDKSSHYSGIVSLDSLRVAHKENRSLASAQLIDEITLQPDQAINDILGVVAGVPYAVPVVDEQGHYYGVVTKSRLLQTLDKD
jgi:glycine betaine/proline transport system ATP-binding protein